MEKAKFALVTGASSGLGNALALSLANENYTVYAGIRKISDKQMFLKQKSVIPVLLDITKPQEIDNTFRFISEQTKNSGLSVLINNAGINYISAFELADETRERELFEVNLLGVMSLTRKFLPLLHQYAKTSTAKIVNVSSMGGFFGLPWEAAYHASKFAMIGFSQSLRYELEYLNISVCCFIPGGMKTNIFKKSIATSNTNQTHQHSAFYERNVQHMHQVMQGFDKSAAPAEKAAQKITNMLRKNKIPLKKYFGMDSKFVRILTWLGLQNVLSKRFSIKS